MTKTSSQYVAWQPQAPKLRISSLSRGSYRRWHFAAAYILPGASVEGFWGALLVAAVVAVLNALLPPLVAALGSPSRSSWAFSWSSAPTREFFCSPTA